MQNHEIPHSLYIHAFQNQTQSATPAVVFIHGVLNDHTVWAPVAQRLVPEGIPCYAVDLSGHGQSKGTPPNTVEDAAKQVGETLAQQFSEPVVLVGHSWGSLIALHAARLQPNLIKSLVLVGTAFPMPVAPALLTMAAEQPEAAIDLINKFSHAHGATDEARTTMLRVLQSNPEHNVAVAGFTACNTYTAGLDDIQASTCPIHFVLGEADKMTPTKAAQSLIDAAGSRAKVFMATGAGHDLMQEATTTVAEAIQAIV